MHYVVYLLAGHHLMVLGFALIMLKDRLTAAQSEVMLCLLTYWPLKHMH